MLIYFLADRLSFLYFERKAIIFRALGAKMKQKEFAIKKFVSEYNPRIFLQAILQEDKGTKATSISTHKQVLDRIRDITEGRVGILEQTLQTIQEDDSTPMLEVTGEISLLPKILLLNITIMFLFDIIEFLYEIFDWDAGYNEIELIITLLWNVTSPLISIPIFCSHMLFGYKNNKEDEEDLRKIRNTVEVRSVELHKINKDQELNA